MTSQRGNAIKCASGELQKKLFHFLSTHICIPLGKYLADYKLLLFTQKLLSNILVISGGSSIISCQFINENKFAYGYLQPTPNNFVNWQRQIKGRHEQTYIFFFCLFGFFFHVFKWHQMWSNATSSGITTALDAVADSEICSNGSIAWLVVNSVLKSKQISDRISH